MGVSVKDIATFPIRAIRTRRLAKEFAIYNLTLSNGTAVWMNRKSKSRLPPLRFRNGFVWNHSRHDDPLEVFREIYIEHFYAPVGDPPSDATVLDVGANIGAVTMYLAAGR